MKMLQRQSMKLFVLGAVLFFLFPLRTPAAAIPEKVQGMKCGATTKSSINISWQGQPSVSGYQIYRSDIYDGKYKKVLDVNPGLTAFCNRKLAVGQEYFYKVRAFTNTGGTVSYGKFSKILRTRTRTNPQKAVVRTRANIRKHAGTSHAIVATVDANTVVSVLCAAKDKSGDAWSFVSCEVNGRKIRGYIYNNILRSGQPSVVTQTGQVTASKLNVRAKPGNTGQVTGSLKYGQKVTILGQEKAPDGSTWLLVQFKKKGRIMKGYVSARYIKLV